MGTWRKNAGTGTRRNGVERTAETRCGLDEVPEEVFVYSAQTRGGATHCPADGAVGGTREDLAIVQDTAGVSRFFAEIYS